MTEPTYTEAEIRKALDRHPSNTGWTAQQVLDQLKRPKPAFAVGQVVYDPDSDEYFKIDNVDVLGLDDFRHLNETELGPHVKALRDVMEQIASGDVGRGGYYEMPAFADKAIQAFDAAVGEGNG